METMTSIRELAEASYQLQKKRNAYALSCGYRSYAAMMRKVRHDEYFFRSFDSNPERFGGERPERKPRNYHSEL